ncbi:MAG: GNAT family N-acetyltransferase [Cellvibrionaceae bacterium]
MELKLKQVSKDEESVVFNVLKENAVWLLSLGIEQWPLEWLESIRREINLSIKSGNYFFALLDNEVVGVVEVLAEPESIWKYDISPSIYIHKLAIKRKFCGLNIGSQIISKLWSISKEKDKEFIRLDCVATNLKLRSYYEKNGFTFVGIANNGLVDLALYEKRAKG